MIKEFFERLRTPELPLLGAIEWWIQITGLRLPKKKLGKLLCILVHKSITLFVITQLIELFFLIGDIDRMITNIKITFQSVACIIKSNTMLYWQKQWKEALAYITEADKFERATRNKERGDVVDRYTRKCSQITYYYCILTFLTNGALIFSNFIAYLTSPTYREALQNGNEPFPHIFSAWTPYDSNKFPLNCVTVVWQVYFSTVVAMIVMAYDTMTIIFMVFFGAKFDLMRLRCAELLGETEVVSDKEFDKRVQQLHTSYTTLVKNIRLVSSLVSPVMFLYFVFCGLTFCASAYQLTYLKSTGQKILIAEYLIFGVTQLFLFCWFSNNMLEKSSMVLRGPYECAWWRGSRRQRRALFLLAGQLRATYVFNAGPFTNLSLPTFLAVVKGAYSYYTLLRN